MRFAESGSMIERFLDRDNYVVEMMHQFGLKAHDLGLVQSRAKSRFLRQLVALEGTARVTKNVLRKRIPANKRLMCTAEK